MNCSKSRLFLGFRPRHPSHKGLVAFGLWILQLSQLRRPMIQKIQPPPFWGQIIHCYFCYYLLLSLVIYFHLLSAVVIMLSSAASAVVYCHLLLSNHSNVVWC